jgi:hypothetical protein
MSGAIWPSHVAACGRCVCHPKFPPVAGKGVSHKSHVHNVARTIAQHVYFKKGAYAGL